MRFQAVGQLNSTFCSPHHDFAGHKRGGRVREHVVALEVWLLSYISLLYGVSQFNGVSQFH
jgi:hypothetical protein